MGDTHGTCFDGLWIKALHEHGERLAIVDSSGIRHDLVQKQVLRGLSRIRGQPLDRLPWLRKRCPYCRVSLLVIERMEQGWSEEDWEDPETAGALELCVKCRFWRWHFVGTEFVNRGGVYVHSYLSCVSKLKEFGTTLPEGCGPELAQWIRSNPGFWNRVQPTRLERIVSDVFRANHSHAEVLHVGGPNDGGVDVLFVEAAGIHWLIQVKRREHPDHAEGVSTIRNLLGAMVLKGTNHGMVVSTADHFTYQAHAAVKGAHEVGMIIRLVDRALLDRMLDPVLPAQPWRSVLFPHFPEYASWLALQIGDGLQEDLFPEHRFSCSIRTDRRLLLLDEVQMVQVRNALSLEATGR